MNLRRSRLAVAAASLSVIWTACGRPSEGQDGGRLDPALERRVEELLPQVVELSNLPANEVPAVRRSSRATLETYLLARLDAEYPGDTFDNLADAYRAFGLIPDTLDLRRLLVDLLLEQAIGYYDPARDVLFIRDEVPEATLDAVLVHELVHALQDQRADLDSLVRGRTQNDARSAAQASVEGHATVVMLAYQIAVGMGTQPSLDGLPDLGPEMAPLIADPSTMPLLAEAPVILREPLLFSYLGGARYVQRLWRSQPGRPPPLGDWLPESTEQLLHTERLLAERDSPTFLSIEEPDDPWSTTYASDLGELEILIYLEEHLGDRRLATRAASGWDGDAYALLADGDDRALVWYTVWDSPADADEFADAYRQAFFARFGGEGTETELLSEERRARLDRLAISGMPAVRIVETGPAAEVARIPQARLERNR